MELDEALTTPQIHFRGWFLGCIFMLAGVILPFLYVALKNMNSLSLVDFWKRK